MRLPIVTDIPTNYEDYSIIYTKVKGLRVYGEYVIHKTYKGKPNMDIGIGTRYTHASL